jgi:Polyphosphate kinase 2 (PPK2)/ABC-type transport auxiliary lipoprotein component
MFKATNTKYAPWYIIRSDDKRRARLNCTHHLLDQIPYKKLPREKAKLPPRVHMIDVHSWSRLALARSRATAATEYVICKIIFLWTRSSRSNVFSNAATPDYLDSQDILARDGSTLVRSIHGRWASRFSLAATHFLAGPLAQRRPNALITDQPQFEVPGYRIFITISMLDAGRGQRWRRDSGSGLADPTSRFRPTATS